MADRTEIAGLVEPIVLDAGLDIDDIRVERASGSGEMSITVVVDGEEGVSLDALTDLTRALNARFDDEKWAQDYTLDVTSRGVDSPLTLPRHWRRNHSRKAELVIRGADGNEETLAGRIGNLVGEQVSIVVNHKGRLAVRDIALADVASAVVTVEFGEPSPAELRLCRGED